jgi:hypothetical protein
MIEEAGAVFIHDVDTTGNESASSLALVHGVNPSMLAAFKISHD